jgi:hypothetical protein
MTLLTYLTLSGNFLSPSIEIREEIINTLNNETAAFMKRDFEEWESFWLQEETSYKSYFIEGEFIEYDGWLEIKSFAKTYFKENPTPETFPVDIQESQIVVRNDLAWVKFEVIDPVRGLKKEYRRLIHTSEGWKISYMSTIYQARD